MITGRSASILDQGIDETGVPPAIVPTCDALMASAVGDLRFAGVSASAYGQEVDLAIDPNGDGLTIDPTGDVLVVTASIMNFAGFSAAFVVGSEVVTEEGGMVLSEDGVSMEGED